MINKKGFTLIELMATIAILVIMSLVIGVNISSILKSTEKNEKTRIKETIENAACVYVDSEECKEKNCNDEVRVEDLIQSGLLDESYRKENGNINVSRSSEGLKTCTYTYSS